MRFRAQGRVNNPAHRSRIRTMSCTNVPSSSLINLTTPHFPPSEPHRALLLLIGPSLVIFRAESCVFGEELSKNTCIGGNDLLQLDTRLPRLPRGFIAGVGR